MPWWSDKEVVGLYIGEAEIPFGPELEWYVYSGMDQFGTSPDGDLKVLVYDGGEWVAD